MIGSSMTESCIKAMFTEAIIIVNNVRAQKHEKYFQSKLGFCDFQFILINKVAFIQRLSILIIGYPVIYPSNDTKGEGFKKSLYE